MSFAACCFVILHCFCRRGPDANRRGKIARVNWQLAGKAARATEKKLGKPFRNRKKFLF